MSSVVINIAKNNHNLHHHSHRYHHHHHHHGTVALPFSLCVTCLQWRSQALFRGWFSVSARLHFPIPILPSHPLTLPFSFYIFTPSPRKGPKSCSMVHAWIDVSSPAGSPAAKVSLIYFQQRKSGHDLGSFCRTKRKVGPKSCCHHFFPADLNDSHDLT